MKTAASAACVALERLGSTEAIAALGELAQEPADVLRRAALVDALGVLGEPACVPPLIALLADHRPCDVPARSARLSGELLADVTTTGQVPVQPSPGAIQPAAQTIAERAADALASITGLHPPFSSSMSEETQQQATQQWRDWHARRTPVEQGP